MKSADLDPFRPPWAERRRRIPAACLWWFGAYLIWSMMWIVSKPEPPPPEAPLWAEVAASMVEVTPPLSYQIHALLRPLAKVIGIVVLLFLAMWAAFAACFKTFERVYGEGGVNYYLHEPGRVKPLLLGNDRAEWCFALNTIPEEGLNSLEEWQRRWSAAGATIINGYKRQVSGAEMHCLICDRRIDTAPDHGEGWWARNSAEPGPYCLARFRLGGICTAHGPGTYDLVRV
jgi:hypothetical protein